MRAGSTIENVMVRTTINLDPTVLEELKERAAREGQTLGGMASLLLAKALHEGTPAPQRGFTWRTQHMGQPLIDLDDREALSEFLDRETFGR